MLFLKSLKKEILSKKIIAILMIFQFTIIINMLSSSYSEYKVRNYAQKQFEYLNINPNNMYSSNPVNYSKNLNSYLDELSTHIGEENIAVVDCTNMPFDSLEKNDKFLEIRQELTKGTFKSEHPTTLELFKVNYGAYNKINPKITDGEGLVESDFLEFVDREERGQTPIIISDKYKDALKVGDILEFETLKFKIKGFFDSELKWFNDNKYVQDKMLLPFFDKVIAPFNLYFGDDEFTKDFENGMFGQCIFLFNEKFSEDEFKGLIVDLNNKYKIKLEISNAQKLIDGFDQYTRKISFSTNFRALLLIIFTIFSIALITRNNIHCRKKEFGVRISTGASLRHLKILILLENFVFLGCATIFSLISTYKYNSTIEFSETVLKDLYYREFYVVLIISVILLILITIVSEIILKKLNKISINELIGVE